jgi:hypothetical protein
MVGVPEIFLSWTKQRSGGTSRERLHQEEDHPCLSNPVPELSESGPSTRNFPIEREKAMTHDPRELTKGGPSKSASGGRVTGSALSLRRFSVSESGDDSTSLGSGVQAKHLRSQ